MAHGGKYGSLSKAESVSGPILLLLTSLPPFLYLDNRNKAAMVADGLSVRRSLDELSVLFPKVHFIGLG